jgi:hypothetical protein
MDEKVKAEFDEFMDKYGHSGQIEMSNQAGVRHLSHMVELHALEEWLKTASTEQYERLREAE